MTRLYWSADHEKHWIGYTDETGFVVFPAEAEGWKRRVRFYGLDPLRVREVPSRLAFNTGFPVAGEIRKSATAA
jgi:hypothetical protein